MNTTLERLAAILHKDYAVAPELLTMDSTLESLGIDSLGVVELLFTVEDTFALKLPSDPVPLHSVGEVVRYIDELLAAQSREIDGDLAVGQG